MKKMKKKKKQSKFNFNILIARFAREKKNTAIAMLIHLFKREKKNIEKGSFNAVCCCGKESMRSHYNS